MNNLQKIGLGLGALGFIGMSTGIGLALGGVAETCCIGALAVSVPGFLYLVSASVATAAMLSYYLGTELLKRYVSKQKGRESSLILSFVPHLLMHAINLAAYIIAQYCVGEIAVQALIAGAISSIGSGIKDAVWYYSDTFKGYDTLRAEVRRQRVGSYVWERIGISMLVSGVATGIAVAATAALPSVLAVNMPTEMLVAAQWLTVILVRALLSELSSFVLLRLKKAEVQGLRDIDFQAAGAWIIGDKVGPTGVERMAEI